MPPLLLVLLFVVSSAAFAPQADIDEEDEPVTTGVGDCTIDPSPLPNILGPEMAKINEEGKGGGEKEKRRKKRKKVSDF